MNHKITIRRDKYGLGFRSARRCIRRGVECTLRSQGISTPCEVSVLLTDNEGICACNRQQRQIDRPTDVLSFPSYELKPGTFDICSDDTGAGRVFLGDMILSLERAGAQAEQYGQAAEDEISYLTVHSVLHLLGYDHVDEAGDKREMRKREKLALEEIRRSLRP